MVVQIIQVSIFKFSQLMENKLQYVMLQNYRDCSMQSQSTNMRVLYYYNIIIAMGNQSHRVNRQGHLGNQVEHRPVPNHQMKCPRCQVILPSGTTFQQFADHIRGCIQANQYVPNYIATHPLINKTQNVQFEKVPVDYAMTKFKWERKLIKAIDHNLLSLNEIDVKKLSFQQKQYWFRNKLQKKRISWEKGADWMKLERSNIFMTSLVEHKKVNMHKQVKIQFIGEKVNDAGGLLREWIHMVTKQVFDDSTGIFTIGNTDQIMYKLKWDEDLDEQFSSQLFQLFGTILGKAIFEKIPIQTYLDRTILRQLCGGSVKIQDIYGYDVQLYKNWTYILSTENLQELDTYFVIHKNNGQTVQQIQLIENGRNIQVTAQNKFQFVDRCIQVQTVQKVKRSIECMRKGILRIIPGQLLSIFEPYEFQMILYGIPFIDLKDWKQNTVYKAPFNQNSQHIRWFWKIMQSFDQEQLGNMLHFCTGSSRTPIHGFKKLESNRGNYAKFMIESTEFLKANPYPKGHTCFNRLQLPLYPDQNTMRIYLTAISKSNLDGIFGLD